MSLMYVWDGSAQGLTAVPEADARRVFQQMIVAVDYCHRLGIANRDIKVLDRLPPQHVSRCQARRLTCQGQATDARRCACTPACLLLHSLKRNATKVQRPS